MTLTLTADLLEACAGWAPAELGALVRLLARHATAGSLPDDDHELSNLSGLGEAWFEAPRGSRRTMGERIRSLFRRAPAAGALEPAGAAAAPPPPQGVLSSAPTSISAAQREQKRSAARGRWAKWRASSQQPELPLCGAAQSDAGPHGSAPIDDDDSDSVVFRKSPKTDFASSTSSGFAAEAEECRAAGLDAEPLALVQGWLQDFARERAPNLLPSLDLEICRLVLLAKGRGTMCELAEFLAAKCFHANVRPRGWGFFPEMVRREFAARGEVAGLRHSAAA